MRQVEKKFGAGFSIADSENELARARLAFGEGLQEATEVGTRAAQRLVVPALWGAALLGGTVAVFALARLLRRRQRGHALIRIAVEPAATERSLVRTAGAALARLALERLLASASRGAKARLLTSEVSRQLTGAQESDDFRPLDSSGVQRNAMTHGRETIDGLGF